MKVKLILPALIEAKSVYYRPIKYSLFPPLGLATLAAYLSADDEIEIEDEHIEELKLDDQPDLVVIQVYITSAYRAYDIADGYRRRGAYVVLGGLHVTSLPEEAEAHADTIFLGPGEDTWPRFLRDFRVGRAAKRYQSTVRTLALAPYPRRDLLKRRLYLVPNSIVVSRGCPHHCDFCYKDAFFRGGRSFYTLQVDRALAEIETLPGRHLYFLDDNLFAHPRFAEELFDGLRGMNRVWQAAGTVQAVLNSRLLDKAAQAGLKSLFVGFESLSSRNMQAHSKNHNARCDYAAAVQALQSRGVMINASFVYGMDEDDPSVFERTVEWAIDCGIETATFHILTPYPGTKLHQQMQSEGRITTRNWDFYDTRHCVYKPRGMSAEELVTGYRRSYTEFYRWGSILRSASAKDTASGMLKHLAYTSGWKKFESFWNLVIKAGRVSSMLPLLEYLLSSEDHRTKSTFAAQSAAAAQAPLSLEAVF